MGGGRLAVAFLELMSAMAKATPLVLDRIVQMCPVGLALLAQLVYKHRVIFYFDILETLGTIKRYLKSL